MNQFVNGVGQEPSSSPLDTNGTDGLLERYHGHDHDHDHDHRHESGVHGSNTNLRLGFNPHTSENVSYKSMSNPYETSGLVS